MFKFSTSYVLIIIILCIFALIILKCPNHGLFPFLVIYNSSILNILKARCNLQHRHHLYYCLNASMKQVQIYISTTCFN